MCDIYIFLYGPLFYSNYFVYLDIFFLLQSLHVKPCVVKRGGFDEFDISDGESETVDHLLFLVHGIGQFCDLKCRSITEVGKYFTASPYSKCWIYILLSANSLRCLGPS